MYISTLINWRHLIRAPNFKADGLLHSSPFENADGWNVWLILRKIEVRVLNELRVVRLTLPV